LGNSTPVLEENLIGPFRDGLRDLGYVDGKNIVIEYRWADGKYERFPALIAELIASKVELIVTAGTPAAVAVKKAAPSTPLVMIAVGDPVGTNLIKSLAHPGGNITGLTSIASDLEGNDWSSCEKCSRKFLMSPSCGTRRARFKSCRKRSCRPQLASSA
jgi:putative ABC transport system substrate-binding protein